MPANFKYTDVLRRGRPRHEKWDSFSLRHPPMSAAHWAKIFSPFDALDGFDERIAEKEVLYESRIELCDDDQADAGSTSCTISPGTPAWQERTA